MIDVLRPDLTQDLLRCVVVKIELILPSFSDDPLAQGPWAPGAPALACPIRHSDPLKTSQMFSGSA